MTGFDVDAVVVGSGTGGLAAAKTLAQAGLSVRVLEKKSPRRAAHTWLNGCEPGVFQEVYGRAAHPHEISVRARRTILVTPGGHTLENTAHSAGGGAWNSIYEVKMHEIRASLLKEVLALGVVVDYETPVSTLLKAGGCVCGVASPRGELRARLVVDASGHESGLRQQVEARPFDRVCPPSDLCVAYQAVHHFDPTGLKGDFPHDVNVSRLSWHGVYSVLNTHTDHQKKEVSFLLGTLASHPKKLWDIYTAHLEEVGGVGARIFGGGGKIPLSHHLSSFVHEGYAAVGDAAFQVNAAHGSGTASSLLAGKLAGQAGAAALARDAGVARREALWAYNVNYMKARGAAMIQQQMMRLFSAALTEAEVDALISEGIMQAGDLTASLGGVALELHLGPTLARIRALTRQPRMASIMGRLAPLIGVLSMMHGAYPGRAWEWDMGGWPGMYNRLVGAARGLCLEAAKPSYQ